MRNTRKQVLLYFFRTKSTFRGFDHEEILADPVFRYGWSGGFINSDPPARSCVRVAAIPKGVLIEIESIAILARDR
jgi:hypothetical protein